MIDLQEINKKVVDYMIYNGLCTEEPRIEKDYIYFCNYSNPQYEEEKESIYKLLEDFYKILDYSVIIDIVQLDDNMGEVMTIELMEE